MIRLTPRPTQPRPAYAIGPAPHPDARLCHCTDSGRQQPRIKCPSCRGTGWVR